VQQPAQAGGNPPPLPDAGAAPAQPPAAPGKGTPTTPPVAVDSTVEVINQGATDVWYIQMSPTTENDYGPDLLDPSAVIRPGGQARVEAANPTGTCQFDALITYAPPAEGQDGPAIEIWDFNLCETARILVTETSFALE
jgi:hypothetical protein